MPGGDEMSVSRWRVLGVSLVLVVGVVWVSEAVDGPLTLFSNLRGRTDENGYLRISNGAGGVVDGPLTILANLRGRTNENGYLRVSCADCGTPAGADGQVQFNSAGAFAGDPDFTFATGNNRLTVTGGFTGLDATFTGFTVTKLAVVTTIATVGAVTYTSSEVMGGLILRDPAGAARADLIATAANLRSILSGPIVGSSFEFTIRNTADAAETITLTTNTGITLSGTMTIAQNNTKRFLVVFTNVGAGTEAATVYSLGTVVF